MKHLTFLFFPLLTLITACSDNGFLFRSVGSYETPQKTGVYLIGAPFEVNGVTYTPREDYDYFDSGNAFWYETDADHPLTANGEVFDSSKLTAMHRTLPLPSVIRLTNLNNQLSTFVRVNDRGPYDNNRIIDVSKAVAEKLNFSQTGVTPVQIEIMALESQKLKQEMLNNQNARQNVTQTTSAGEVILDPDKILYPEMTNQQIDNLTLRSRKKKRIEKQENVLNQPVEEHFVQSKITQPSILYAGSADTPKYYVQIGAFSLADSAQKVKENLKNHSNLFVTEKFKKKRLLHFVRIGPYKTQAECANVLDKIHASGYPDAIIVFE